MLLDAACRHEWSAVLGDPAKCGLGFSSMVFDAVFMVQHWGLYRGGKPVRDAAAAELGGEDEGPRALLDPLVQ